MLSYVATDISGREIILPKALSAVLSMDEDVPADALYAVFPYTKLRELKAISVYENSKLFFVGTVDEEERVVDPAGEYLRMSARSPAAYLLDNEAVPESYNHPSARMIYERHAKPYGIALGDGDDETYFGELDVTKGESRWSAIRSFCNACYSRAPRVSADGVLYMKGVRSKGRVVFGGDVGEFRYTKLTESVKRCEELSRVRVKLSAADGYIHTVDDPDAIARGIVRERCLNAMTTDTPLKCADTMLENSRKKAYSLTLTCPGILPDILGCEADVRADISDKGGELYVSSLKYRVDSHGESTVAVLKRRNV